MVVTLADMRTRLRRRLEDTGASNPHWSDAELDQYTNESLQDLYDNIYMVDRHILPISQLDYDWPANQLEVDLVQLLGTRDFDLYLIESYTDSDNTFDSSNTTNYPVPMIRDNPEQLYRRFSVDVTSARHYDTPNLNWSGSGGGTYYRYAITSIDNGGSVQINMRVAPVPVSSLKMRFSFLKPFKPLSLTTDAVLDNQFFRFIDLVEYGAVLKAKGRSDESTDPVMQAYASRLAMLRSWLDARSRTGTPRVVVDGY